MYIVKNLNEIGNISAVKSEAERKIEAKESSFNFSFSPKTEEMFAKFRMNAEEKTPSGGKGRGEKKIGDARKKRGRGRGCE